MTRTFIEQQALNDQLINAVDDGVEATNQAIRDGAEVNARTDTLDSSLHYAACCRKPDAAIALLEAGADIEAKNDTQDTPLHLAAHHGHTETAKALLAAGANLTSLDSRGNTPMDNAHQREHPELADYLQSIADGKTQRPTPKNVGLDMKKRNNALKILSKPAIGEHTAKAVAGMEAQRQAALNDPSEGI